MAFELDERCERVELRRARVAVMGGGGVELTWGYRSAARWVQVLGRKGKAGG